MVSLLPTHVGLLPYWQLVTSALSLFNTVQCYRSKHHALRTYAGPNATAQVTDLGARMFGTWTALSCCIRLYSVYDIQHEGIYLLAFFTYVIALAHFGVEWLGYGTMAAGIELLRVAVACGWHIMDAVAVGLLRQALRRFGDQISRFGSLPKEGKGSVISIQQKTKQLWL